jgi:hypothetical protein
LHRYHFKILRPGGNSMATAKSKSSKPAAKKRSTARPAAKRATTKTVKRRVTTRTARTTRRTTQRRTFALPGGLKLNVNEKSFSVSSSSGPLSGTWSSSGRSSMGMKLPGGVTVRKSV